VQTCALPILKGDPDMRREQTVYNLIEDAESPPDTQNTQALSHALGVPRGGRACRQGKGLEIGSVKKLRIGVMSGRRSGEHEVSLASAAAVFGTLDPERYDPVAIRIEKDGRWTLPAQPPRLASAAAVLAGKTESTAH